MGPGEGARNLDVGFVPRRISDPDRSRRQRRRDQHRVDFCSLRALRNYDRPGTKTINRVFDGTQFVTQLIKIRYRAVVVAQLAERSLPVP